jgi:hypothetical protein
MLDRNPTTVVNRICSRAQKGFNDSRFTQECLINVLETIRHCNNNNISGAVVVVDMAKAFDTLSHGYLEEVFKFFRMGTGIRRWLRILGTNRTACIILDDYSYSRNFRLGRGAAQGDNISPDCFNFGDQILIFKIELDPQISGVWQNFQIPPVLNPAPPPPPPLPHSRAGKNRKTIMSISFHVNLPTRRGRMSRWRTTTRPSCSKHQRTSETYAGSLTNSQR